MPSPFVTCETLTKPSEILKEILCDGGGLNGMVRAWGARRSSIAYIYVLRGLTEFMG